ncbi:MAG TPA: ParB/RepB/Spo0J family partition protein [Gemmatimonadales bacterium]|jgi:ParB family transcriptional regulator, chromosome partitioning protein
MTETKRLGRGLEALLGPISKDEAIASGGLREIAVSAIAPNPYQPRRDFEEAPLRELADSIAASGLLQPVVVRARPNGRYELIAGERRWRAVQRLGWQKIPAVIKEVDDRALLTLALIENLQRDDLSPLDAAVGYQRLMEEFSLPQQEVARLVGKDRSTVSNTLRLLRLPTEVQTLLQQRKLSEGHARALLALHDPREIIRLGRECSTAEWSVRDLEARVRGEQVNGAPVARKMIRRPRAEPRNPSADVRLVEDALRKRLQTDVRVTARRRGRGAVTIHYYSNDDLARVLELILGAPFSG